MSSQGSSGQRIKVLKLSPGFTLVELLVVIGIIAVLAAILFPVIAKAREKARQSTCITNQRQLATTLLMYAQDNDEYLPPNVISWQDIGVDHNIVRCPTSGPSAPIAYLFNSSMNGKALGDIKDSTQEWFTVDAMDGQPINRHSGMAVVSFADGHVGRRWPMSPSSIGILLYTSVVGQTTQVFRINTNGTGKQQLTNGVVNNPGNPTNSICYPTWNTEGSKILYDFDTGPKYQIYSMNADGTNQKMLYSNGYQPRWSTDGTKIAFSAGSTICTMNADGSGVVQLISGSNPEWSPDGSKIAFTGSSSGLPVAAVMNADGSNLIKLTSVDMNGHRPRWNHTGTQIICDCCLSTGGWGIYIVNPNGTNLTRLTVPNIFSAGGCFSPDDSLIYYTASISGAGSNDLRIFSMAPDGSGKKQLTQCLSGNDNGFTLSPDGTKIAFSSSRGGVYDLYVMNADGSNVVQLTNTPYAGDEWINLIRFDAWR